LQGCFSQTQVQNARSRVEHHFLMLTRSLFAALVSLARLRAVAVCVLSLGLGLGPGIGLKLASVIAALLRARLKDKEALLLVMRLGWLGRVASLASACVALATSLHFLVLALEHRRLSQLRADLLGAEHVYGSDCSICLRPFEDGQILHVAPCEHGVHAGCWLKWLRHRRHHGFEPYKLCPTCMGSCAKATRVVYRSSEQQKLRFVRGLASSLENSQAPEPDAAGCLYVVFWLLFWLLSGSYESGPVSEALILCTVATTSPSSGSYYF